MRDVIATAVYYIIWEGVTMYLERAAVEDTLRKIAGTAKGSVVAFDERSGMGWFRRCERGVGSSTAI